MNVHAPSSSSIDHHDHCPTSTTISSIVDQCEWEPVDWSPGLHGGSGLNNSTSSNDILYIISGRLILPNVKSTDYSESFLQPDMSSTTEIASAFIQGAPPGELQDVVNDIQSLTSDTDPSLISKLKPAFQKYNEEQLATTELPGGEKQTVSPLYCVALENRLTYRMERSS